jgi:hypothetical protein
MAQQPPSFLNSLVGAPSLVVSTSPPNGDRYPSGVAVVPTGFPGGGTVRVGDVLVSNFGDAHGRHGKGRTVVAISPAGDATTFFEAPGDLGPVGLTTALVALRTGFVVVGTTPTLDGTAGTAQNGGLFFLDRSGGVLFCLGDSMLLRGPWGLTVDESSPLAPLLYVSNVLDGTVSRVNVAIERTASGPMPTIVSLTRVASGFAHGPGQGALAVGPASLTLSADLTGLYVCDAGNNRVQFVAGVRQASGNRGAGTTVVLGPPMNGPLGVAPSPIGTLLTASGDGGGASTPQNLLVEFFPRGGRFVATRQMDPGAPGALSGIAIKLFGGRQSLLYADRQDNTLKVLPQRGV